MNIFSGSRNWFLRDRREFGFEAVFELSFEKTLYETIFEAVETDHPYSSAFVQKLWKKRQRSFYLPEFVVDGDTERLESTRGRMDSGPLATMVFSQ